MERAEAEAIYDRGREVVVDVLLALSAQNALLAEQVAKLAERVARQEERIAELERQLGRNSRNSSSPPSQDPPGAAKGKREPGSGRGPGGQPGHRGHGRRLMSAARIDRSVEHWPESCACGHGFGDDERRPVGRPGRHQVVELPDIAVEVTEHLLMGLRCPRCGKRTAASLPADVACGAFGPRLRAAIATLAVRNRVSRRDTTELLGELFGADISTGTVDAIVRRVGGALAEPYGDLLDHVRDANAVNIDETGWRLRGKQRALWGAVTARAAVFRVAPDRHEREAHVLLGDQFAGVVCSDRWWAYGGYDPARRQVCWSHLVRDFTAQAEGLAAQKDFGDAGLDIARRVFCAWQQFQADGDRRVLRRHVAPLQRELKALLTKYSSKAPRHKRTRGLARNLLKVWPALWTFTTVDAIEPTNNAAERALRGPVIHRKLSLGSQSETGEHTIARLLSASVTCRLQHRSLFGYLSDLLAASARSDPIPLLT